MADIKSGKGLFSGLLGGAEKGLRGRKSRIDAAVEGKPAKKKAKKKLKGSPYSKKGGSSY